jgi:phosphatidylinositol kinase/protein kinase (PI-3  family)
MDELAGPAFGQKMDKNRIAFAKAVMKRTAAKVHGLLASGHSLPFEEHARALITQATSAQRLSRMYEGWMPWL